MAPQAAADLEKRFHELAKKWQNETRHLSVAARMAEHPAYQQIVALGKPVVSILLAELRRKPRHWFLALHAITGADPVPEESAGDVSEMARAWIEWGKTEGYIG